MPRKSTPYFKYLISPLCREANEARQNLQSGGREQGYGCVLCTCKPECARTHTHQEAEYVITSWFFFSADRSFASLSFQTNMRTSLTSSVHVCVCVCVKGVWMSVPMWRRWSRRRLVCTPAQGWGAVGGSLPRLEGLSNTEPAAGGCTKEKFFSPLSRLELETASLKQHGKWHKQALNPARLVCSSDHEMNRRQRCVSNDTRYRRRCGSQRGGGSVSEQQAHFLQ